MRSVAHKVMTPVEGAIAVLLIVGLSSYASAQGLPPLAHQTVGSEFKYTVKAGETLVSIGARNGIESGTLAAMNGLKPKTPLKSGQVLDIDNRHIVPPDLPDGILINLPQRKLFFLNDGRVEGNYPIGPGKAAFATPIGSFSVIQMRENPTWYVYPNRSRTSGRELASWSRRRCHLVPIIHWAAIGSD
jgi:L,D-transpeptidase ErfK/SrfK